MTEMVESSQSHEWSMLYFSNINLIHLMLTSIAMVTERVGCSQGQERSQSTSQREEIGTAVSGGYKSDAVGWWAHERPAGATQHPEAWEGPLCMYTYVHLFCCGLGHELMNDQQRDATQHPETSEGPLMFLDCFDALSYLCMYIHTYIHTHTPTRAP